MPYRQSGSALLVALFVMVVVAALLIQMGRLLQLSQESEAVEAFALRAHVAAHNGLEFAAAQLLPVNGPAADCATLNRNLLLDNMPGMRGCSAQLQCETDQVGSERLVTVVATGRCNSSPVNGQSHVRAGRQMTMAIRP